MSGWRSSSIGNWLLELPLGKSSESSFDLEKAVCNHGFFMMAPNSWNPSSKTLQRPLRLADGTTSATVSISQPPGSSSLRLQIYHSQVPSLADRRAILVRMAVDVALIGPADELLSVLLPRTLSSFFLSFIFFFRKIEFRLKTHINKYVYHVTRK